jgi:hypothetical protein
VRRGIAQGISKMAAHLFQGNQWPECLEYIANCAGSQDENHRELAFIILGNVVPLMIEYMPDSLPTLKQMVKNGLQDPSSSKVKTSAMDAALVAIVMLCDDERLMNFQDYIPIFMTLCGEYLNAGMERETTHTLEGFIMMSESPHPVITPHLEQIVQMAMTVCQSESLEVGTRETASQVVSTLISEKPKLFKKKGLVPSVLLAFMDMCTKCPIGAGVLKFHEEDEKEGLGFEEDDEDVQSIHLMAQLMIDSLAMAINKKFLFNLAHQKSLEFMQDPDPMKRKTGCATLGIISEGCQELMAEQLDTLLPPIIALARDPHGLVRECACFCLGQWAEHLQPYISDHHQPILQAAFDLLNDVDNIKVQLHVCTVLENMCTNMEPSDIMAYLTPLMQRLVQMLQSVRSRTVQEMILSAMAACSVAAQTEFQPYVEGLVPLLVPMMENTEENNMMLRGRALELMGHIATAIGKDAFEPFFLPTMKIASDGLQFDNTELKEFIYTFFSNIVSVKKKEMGEIVGQLVPHLIGAVRESDGGVEDADDDDDLDEEQFEEMQKVRTALLGVKETSIEALGQFCEHTEDLCAPMMPEIIAALKLQIMYWHESVRSKAIISLSQVLACLAATVQQPTEFANGLPAQVPIHDKIKTVVNQITNDVILRMKADTDKEVVAECCIFLHKSAELFGPALFENCLQPVNEVVLMLLKEEAVCQKTADDDDDDEFEHDFVLLDCVTDLVGVMGRILGQAFVPFFNPHHFQAILKFSGGVRPDKDRSMAIGCFAEVFEGIGAASSTFLNVMVPLMQRGLADGSIDVQRNSTFCVGIIAEVCGKEAEPHYMSFLQGLRPLFARPSQDALSTQAGKQRAALVDNACSAVARMIRFGPSALPLGEVLPVFVNALPLQDDFNENKVVYTCVSELLARKAPEVMDLIPKCTQVFSSVLCGGDGNDELEEEVAHMLIASLKNLCQEFGQQMEGLLKDLPGDQGQRIFNLVQQA